MYGSNMNKKEKLAEWRRRKNAPVICEDIQDGLTSSIAVRGTLTICDGKSDSEWDNDPTNWKWESAPSQNGD
jgi:hypothetical protein